MAEIDNPDAASGPDEVAPESDTASAPTAYYPGNIAPSYLPPGGFVPPAPAPIPQRNSEVMFYAGWVRTVGIVSAFVQLGTLSIPDKWLTFFGNPAIVETGAMILSAALSLAVIPLVKKIRAARRNHGKPCAPLLDNKGRLKK